MNYSNTPLSLFASMRANGSLIYRLAQRDVVGKYRGSVLGLGWSFFNPLLMLLIYSFVFSVIFQSRLGADAESGRGQFALILFAGLMLHMLLAEIITQAPQLVRANASYVKKVVFPLEILPVVSVLSALFHALVSLTVLLLAVFIMNGSVNPTVLLIPMVLLPFAAICLGLSYFFSALGVYFRDVGQITNVLAMIALFLAPVFYTLDSIPQNYRLYLQMNPLTIAIEQFRALLLFGQLPDWTSWGVYSGISLICLWFGYWWFQRTRSGFADVI